MARPPFRVGSFPSACPRSYTNLRPTSSQHLGRRNGPSQIRRLSGAIRPSRDSYVAYPTKRHDAFALLHPRFTCARYASRPHALFAQSSIRRTYSSTAEAPSSSIEGSQSVRPEPPDHLNEKEKAIFDRLIEALEPVELQVEDISGGCGSMYAVAITAEKFKGLPVIKQHRLVNEVLGEDIKSWHGIQLRTKAP